MLLESLGVGLVGLQRRRRLVLEVGPLLPEQWDAAAGLHVASYIRPRLEEKIGLKDA